MGKATKLELNEKLCAESELPPNLTEGCKIEKLGLGGKIVGQQPHLEHDRKLMDKVLDDKEHQLIEKLLELTQKTKLGS